MDRMTLLQQLTSPGTFPFWVPVISHYRQVGGRVEIDAERMLLHARQIAPYTRCWMLAGTTGDGWALDDAQYAQLLDYACDLQARFAVDGHGRLSLILGALAPTTGGVMARIEQIKRRLGLPAGAPLEENLSTLNQYGILGVTICAPVGESVTQDAAAAHIDRICEESALPVVVYQLPQVTRNRIAPETFSALARRHETILFFKDSGGGDEVAHSPLAPPGVVMVRGAEGGYAQALKSLGGRYDGWLLSTGNAFAAQLAAVVAHVQRGDRAAALAESDRLSLVVEAVFEEARKAPSGNPFSNANRAVDHLRAYGAGWSDRPLPLLQDGAHLPAALIEGVANVLQVNDLLPVDGYVPKRNNQDW